MRKIGRTFFYLAIIFMLFILVLSVFSQTETAKKRVRYDYSAKRVISDNKTGITILKGDAKFIKKNTESSGENDYVYADQITIYQDVETKKTIKMEAMGNVKIKEADMNVTCERAVMKYDPENIIEMEGSPAIVVQEDNKIEAPLIKYYRDDDRMEAEAGEGSVVGQITIEENETQKDKKGE